MDYYRDLFDIDTFKWWAGARDRMQGATASQREQVRQRLEDTFTEETPTATQINDLVWFECDDIFNSEEESDEME